MAPNFVSAVAEEVQRLSETWTVNTGKAFLMWYAISALGVTEDTAYESVATDGGNDKSIDLFLVDSDNERVVIAQGKYHKAGKYKPDDGELLQLVHTTDWLGDKQALTKEGRPELLSASEDYTDALARGYSVEFHYVFMGTATKEVIDRANLLNAAALEDGPPRRVSVVDYNSLESIFEAASDLDRRIERAEIELDPSSYFESKGTFGKALTATLPAQALVDLHETHGDRLFDRNVRLYLGSRQGTVNAGLKATLSSTTDSKNFWAYNNGVTIVCKDLSVDNDMVTLRDFSIVNGCQTTVSLAQADSLSPETKVLVRFIQAPNALVDNIIQFTNSQTPIRAFELKSQDKRQKRLQTDLAKSPNPYYYALRRGEARTLSATERAKYTRDSRFQTIPHDILAQYLGSFRQLPYIAYKEKGRLFTDKYDDVFPTDLSVIEALLAWRSGEVAQARVKEQLAQAKTTGDKFDEIVWGRGGALFTTSVMSMLLRKRNGGNYLVGLSREVATSKKTLERLKPYAVIASVFYLRATRAIAGNDLARLPAVLRSQDASYPQLTQKVNEEWEIQSINADWVNGLPKL